MNRFLTLGLALGIVPFLVSCNSLTATASPAAASPSSPARPAARPGSALLYYAKADYAFADNSAVVANPYIGGALFQIIWSEVEKADGVYDWSQVDRWIEPWIKAGKPVALRVMWSTSGAWPRPYYKTPTPRWVWEKGAVFAYHPETGTEIPLIWDPIYQVHAWRFLKKVAARYGQSPHLLFIDVTPGAETNPYRFGTINRTDPDFKDTFEKIKTSDGRSYSEELWIDTLKEWIVASKEAAAGVPLLVTLNVGGLRVRDRMGLIGDYCVSQGLQVGQNGLGGRSYQDADSDRTKNFLRWGENTKIFFEMVQRSGGRTGTLLEVMKAAERIRCNYLNVYPEDVQAGTPGAKGYNAESEAALKYGYEALVAKGPL